MDFPADKPLIGAPFLSNLHRHCSPAKDPAQALIAYDAPKAEVFCTASTGSVADPLFPCGRATKTSSTTAIAIFDLRTYVAETDSQCPSQGQSA